jgi:hypothetical protein
VNRILDTAIGGWNLSNILFINSGNFLTPNWSGTDPTGTRYTSSRTPASVTIRPNELTSPNLPSDQRSVKKWFDPTAFGPPSPGEFGSSAKGVIIGPGNWVLNSGIYKTFRIVERLTLRVEMTATGVLNHPSWTNPATTITDVASVGVITGATGMRSMRFGARLEW